ADVARLRGIAHLGPRLHGRRGLPPPRSNRRGRVGDAAKAAVTLEESALHWAHSVTTSDPSPSVACASPRRFAPASSSPVPGVDDAEHPPRKIPLHAAARAAKCAFFVFVIG